MKTTRGGNVTLVAVVAAGLLRTAAAQAETPADRFAELDALLAQANFEDAALLARELLRGGNLARRDVARAHLALGVVAAGRGDRTRGFSEFELALRLTADLEPSAAIGPSITQVLEEARVATNALPSVVPKVELSREAGGALVVRLVTSSSNRDIAKGVRLDLPHEHPLLRWQADEVTVSRLEVSVEHCLAVTASVTDDFGNELWPALASLGPCAPARTPAQLDAVTPAFRPAAASVLRHDSKRSLSVPVWCGIAASAGLGIATAVSGVVALNERADYRTSLRDPTRTVFARWQLRETALNAEHRATVFGLLTAVAASSTLVLYSFTDARSNARVTANASGLQAEVRRSF